MTSAVRALIPRSLAYLKKIYYCNVTINVKALPPLQPRINSTNIDINQTTHKPAHKLSYATILYLVAVEQGQLTVSKNNIS